MNYPQVLLYHNAMSRLSNHLRRHWLDLILSAILALLGLSLALGPLGPRDLVALRVRRRALEARRTELTSRNISLRTTVQNLRSNDRYLEHLIRRELGFTRPDELVYKFTGDSAAPQP
ncbi:MAG TPA: septum formation initiator family protein [Candidatus Binataceae bacterium]|nr:septum formation initiator family protein [Candidatus Binataceae bacterium]